MSKKGLKLSLAESCTGGMISSIITSISGSSLFFLGSAVTYSNESKEKVLGVSHDTLTIYGAVSSETSIEMAKGSLKIYGSDIAASVTGISGPSGGTKEKPVGTVWIAVTDGVTVVSYENHFKGSRDKIRKQSVDALLTHIIEMIENR
ncbi:MAG: CinA family protein [archaeon]|nr:CinA family protein [archaeon]